MSNDNTGHDRGERPRYAADGADRTLGAYQTLGADPDRSLIGLAVRSVGQ
ncbi:hypothetical protein [Halorubrum sp. GN11_10-6_MGM]|nr:hypothetical protein [Halorubrum sp. GN11_10-6_MGM]